MLFLFDLSLSLNLKTHIPSWRCLDVSECECEVSLQGSRITAFESSGPKQPLPYLSHCACQSSANFIPEKEMCRPQAEN